MTAPDEASIAIVIPVQSMADHVAACVQALVPQLRPGDELVVIDDASTDDSAARAADAGATVLANTDARGPYAARAFGVRHTTAPFLLFVDARSRPRPGFLDAHRALLSRDGVALSCTDVAVAPSVSFAGRVAKAQDGWRLRHKIRGSVLDFSPTANLGVTREAFEKVGGFRAVRSGADADLCWRVNLAGFGEISGDARELMQWVPRDTLSGLIEQNFRYGRSSVYLEHVHRATMAGATASPEIARRRTVHPELATAPTPAGTDRPAEIGARALNLALRAGRFVGTLEHRDVQPDNGSALAGPLVETTDHEPGDGPERLSSLAQLREDVARYRADTWISKHFWWFTERSFWAIAAYRIGRAIPEVVPGRPGRTLQKAYSILYSPLVQVLTSIELPLEATIGPGLRIHHGVGLVVGGRVVIGRGCTLRQGVNIGRVLTSHEVPRLGDDVDCGAYSQILGDVSIGDRARIGPHSVVLRDVPAGATAFGVPARVTSTDERPAKA